MVVVLSHLVSALKYAKVGETNLRRRNNLVSSTPDQRGVRPAAAAWPAGAF